MFVKILYLCVFSFIIISIISCANKTTDQTKQFIEYNLAIKDSIVVKKVGALTLRDKNKQRDEYLFTLRQTYEIIITDKFGAILHTFKPTGEGDRECGQDFLSAGYFSENSVVVLSKRGYFFYTLDGKFIRKIADATPIARTGGNIKTINVDGDTCLITLFKHYFDPQKYDNMLFKKEYYEQVRLFTLYNLNKNKSELIIGYEPNSFYRKFQHFYVSTIPPQISFNEEHSQFYVLLNPDNNIYIYNIKDSIALSNIIPIHAEHFKLPFLQPFREKRSATEFEDALKSAALNSAFESFSVKGDTVLLVYSVGIEESNAKNINSIDELNKMTAQRKSYMQVYIKGEKASRDIQIPNYLYRVAVFNDSQDIIMQTDFSLISERPDCSVFYKCKLEKLLKH